MANRFLLLACILIISMGLIVVEFPQGPVAIALVFFLSAIAIFFFRKYTQEKEFLTTVFLVGLAARMAFGLLIHVFELRSFFGGDALSYDENGAIMVDAWLGRGELTGVLRYQSNPQSGAGWGMNYMTAGLYYVIGRNIFAAQSLCAVIGAATAPMVFYCSKKIYNNLSVAKTAAIAIAIFPSFVIWSGQLLKDGLIIFLLVTTMTMVLQLQERFSYIALAAMTTSIFGILSLRFYIFYMVVIAVVGSFVIGRATSAKSILRGTLVLALMGIALMYLGVGRSAEVELRVFANLERVQTSRLDLARSAESGFGEETDVSTTEGALFALPAGFAYLYFAPFPWQTQNLRQAITIPEVLLWWASIPFLIIGLIYTVKKRLRNALPILVFTLLLTLAYSIFQGNVGTAYRQRTQIQVFLFILIGVGWTVYREERENKRMLQTDARRRVDSQLGGFRQERERARLTAKTPTEI